MNAVDRAGLAAVPIPVAPDGQPARACVVYERGVWRTAWMEGVRKEAFGPAYRSAREAADASRILNERGGA